VLTLGNIKTIEDLLGTYDFLEDVGCNNANVYSPLFTYDQYYANTVSSTDLVYFYYNGYSYYGYPYLTFTSSTSIKLTISTQTFSISAQCTSYNFNDKDVIYCPSSPNDFYLTRLEDNKHQTIGLDRITGNFNFTVKGTDLYTMEYYREFPFYNSKGRASDIFSSYSSAKNSLFKEKYYTGLSVRYEKGESVPYLYFYTRVSATCDYNVEFEYKCTLTTDFSENYNFFDIYTCKDTDTGETYILYGDDFKKLTVSFFVLAAIIVLLFLI